jgi:NRAMP (natural resistance-associated macrophage protein)-like metal ion transporter
MKTEKIITKAAEAPAKALENAIVKSEKALASINRPLQEAEGYWYAVGPGLTTGASDDDPSGVVTYTQAGAKYGYSFLWLSWLTFPLMGVIQEMCARIGMATGRGLAGNIRMRYSKHVLYFLVLILFVANTINLGADLGAMSKSAQLILPGVSYITFLFVFAIISLGLQIFVSYSRYAKFLKYLSFVLFLYIATALTLDNLPWGEILKTTILPKFAFSRDTILIITAILGTTISPYLFFWQTSQEVEERRQSGKFIAKAQHQVLANKQVNRMRFDVWFGMLFSNVIMFFVIVTSAAVLFPQGIEINSAEEAAKALLPLAGNQAYTLFALGVIGTGLLAVPVLAGSSAYALAETFHWTFGFSKGLKHAHAFYGVIIIAFIIGLLINLININPITALIYSAVLNGLAAPIIMYFILKISGDKTLMGPWVNGNWSRVIGWGATVIMTVAAVATLASFIF